MHLKTITACALALLATGIASFAAGRTKAQDEAQDRLSKEHKWLATLAGDYTVDVGGAQGTNRIESALGGLWNLTHFESTAAGHSFEALEMLGYDPEKKKFISVSVDSMTPRFTTMEGTYDAKAKTLTMRGLTIGQDGKEVEMTHTYVFKDEGMDLSMNIGGTPLMTVEYTRKK